MRIKYFTHNNAPLIQGETSELPSECRVSDNMDIKETIARFFRAGALNVPVYEPISAEEKEQMFDGLSEQELEDADLVEQKNFLDQVKDNLAQQDTVDSVKQEGSETTESVKQQEESTPADSAKAE